jgi:hypothetical protein
MMLCRGNISVEQSNSISICPSDSIYNTGSLLKLSKLTNLSQRVIIIIFLKLKNAKFLKFEREHTDDQYDVPNKPGFARPVIIHRAIFGSLERFIAILCEHTAGKWPFFVNPK